MFEFRTTKGLLLSIFDFQPRCVDFFPMFEFRTFNFLLSMCEFRTTNLRLVYRNVRIPDYQSAVGIPECANSGLPNKKIFSDCGFFRAPVIIILISSLPLALPFPLPLLVPPAISFPPLCLPSPFHPLSQYYNVTVERREGRER